MELMDAQKILSLVSNINQSRDQLLKSSGFITTWSNWYAGKVPSFHRTYTYNGKRKVYRDKKSMKMAKQVCEDWASLLMNEKVQIVVKDNETMDKLLMSVDFWNKSNKSVEFGFALSMSALVWNLKNITLIKDEKGENVVDVSFEKCKITLSTYSARMIVPITWDNGEIVEVAFVQENTNNTIVNAHLIDEETGNYKIVCFTLPKNNGQTENRVKECYVIDTESTNKWFGIVHPNLVNNLEIDSPYPISIFGNSIDTLKVIDDIYDSYDIEFLNGKKRTYVSAKLNEVDKETGQIENTFDPNDSQIYVLPESDMSINGVDKPVIVNVTDALRSQEHSQAIQDQLNFLSKQCGLGVDYYRFEKGRVMTATQVISEKSDTFRNLKKHEGIFEKVLIDMIKTLMYICNHFEIEDYRFTDDEEVSINFDDSIIEDKNTEKDNDRKDVDGGVMSLVEFRMKWYGEDEETAKENIKKFKGDALLSTRIASFGEALSGNLITVKEYVKQVFNDKDETEQDEIVAQLEELRKADADISGLGLYNPPAEQ